MMPLADAPHIFCGLKCPAVTFRPTKKYSTGWFLRPLIPARLEGSSWTGSREWSRLTLMSYL